MNLHRLSIRRELRVNTGVLTQKIHYVFDSNYRRLDIRLQRHRVVLRLEVGRRRVFYRTVNGTDCSSILPRHNFFHTIQ